MRSEQGCQKLGDSRARESTCKYVMPSEDERRKEKKKRKKKKTCSGPAIGTEHCHGLMLAAENHIIVLIDWDDSGARQNPNKHCCCFLLDRSENCDQHFKLWRQKKKTKPRGFHLDGFSLPAAPLLGAKSEALLKVFRSYLDCHNTSGNELLIDGVTTFFFFFN